MFVYSDSELIAHEHPMIIIIYFSAGWESVGEVKAGTPTAFKVEGLTPKKQYKFRIRAVNKLGSSEPALFAKPVLAKDPWGKLHNK